MTAYEDLCERLAKWTRSFPAFARHLDQKGVRYLSWSKVSAVEFCPRRYLLEWVQGIPLDPPPAYYVKGTVFHEGAAKLYRGIRDGKPPSVARLHAFVNRHLDEDAPHLKNALRLAAENVHAGCEVVAVETPFALDLGADLPPALGIIDLVLRRGNAFTVVDHKTGRTFGEPDDLQLVLYREWVCRAHGAAECAAVFDEYRWVNDLETIRKPAFRRTEVALAPDAFSHARRRLERADRAMLRVEKAGNAPIDGPCYMCPYVDVCR